MRPDRKMQFNAANSNNNAGGGGGGSYTNPHAHAYVHQRHTPHGNNININTHTNTHTNTNHNTPNTSCNTPRNMEYISDYVYNILTTLHAGEFNWWLIWHVCNNFTSNKTSIMLKFNSFQVCVYDCMLYIVCI